MLALLKRSSTTPKILILDEPTDGLDPNQKHEVRKLINEMAKEKVIVISTHLLDEVDTVCSRAIVIAQGKIVADGTPADLQARSDLHNAVSLRLAASLSDKAKGTIEAVSGIDRVVQSSIDGDFVNFTAFSKSGQVVIDEVSAALKSADIDVLEIQAERGRLDEVFRRLTTAA